MVAALPLARVRSEQVALVEAGLWRFSTLYGAVWLDLSLRERGSRVGNDPERRADLLDGVENYLHPSDMIFNRD